MMLESKYDIGQIVFLITDIDQRERLVVEIMIRQTGVMYNLAHGSHNSWHYEMEMCIEKNVITATTN